MRCHDGCVRVCAHTEEVGGKDPTAEQARTHFSQSGVHRFFSVYEEMIYGFLQFMHIFTPGDAVKSHLHLFPLSLLLVVVAPASLNSHSHLKSCYSRLLPI